MIWPMIPQGILEIFDFSKLNIDGKINALSAVSETLAAFLSLFALVLSLWVFARQQRINRWQLRLHREDHIIEWSRSCLTLLAEIEERTNSNIPAATPMFDREEFVRLRSRLSALIDEGRLYFPNLQDPAKGANKDAAYRGHRQPILDTLVFVYDKLGMISEETNAANRSEQIFALNKLRRRFVSEVQDTIDPRTFNKVRA
ncbi:MAG: hypothetical protein ACRBCJ_09930 [Hyphomicrobiaceae bacterium]